MTATPHPSLGFTITELLYVLAIIGIVAAIALPRIDFGRTRVDTVAMTVGSRLMVAQRVAVLRQHDVRLVFDVAGNRITVHEDANNDGLVNTGEATRSERLGEGISFGLASADPLLGTGDAVTFADDPGGQPALVFHRNGSASQEGAVHVTTSDGSRAEADRAVRVERATGLARCWSRRTGTWTEGC